MLPGSALLDISASLPDRGSRLRCKKEKQWRLQSRGQAENVHYKAAKCASSSADSAIAVEKPVHFRTKPCYFFFTPRGCVKGTKCNFRHDKLELPPSSYIQRVGSNEPSEPILHEQRRKRPSAITNLHTTTRTHTSDSPAPLPPTPHRKDARPEAAPSASSSAAEGQQKKTHPITYRTIGGGVMVGSPSARTVSTASSPVSPCTPLDVHVSPFPCRPPPLPVVCEVSALGGVYPGRLGLTVRGVSPAASPRPVYEGSQSPVRYWAAGAPPRQVQVHPHSPGVPMPIPGLQQHSGMVPVVPASPSAVFSPYCYPHPLHPPGFSSYTSGLGNSLPPTQPLAFAQLPVYYQNQYPYFTQHHDFPPAYHQSATPVLSSPASDGNMKVLGVDSGAILYETEVYTPHGPHGSGVSLPPMSPGSWELEPLWSSEQAARSLFAEERATDVCDLEDLDTKYALTVEHVPEEPGGSGVGINRPSSAPPCMNQSPTRSSWLKGHTRSVMGAGSRRACEIL